MKKYILIITLFIFFCNRICAQSTYDIRLVYASLDCNTNIACYDVQLRNTAGTNWGLAGQNYRLYYDASLAAFTSGTSVLGSDYQNFNLVQDIQDADASGAGNFAFESNLGFLNYSIDLLNPMTGGDNLLADGTWKTTSQLCFALEGDILTNPTSCLEAVWGRQDSTSSYGTSFVEVSEWVEANNTQMATGDAYNDLTSADGAGSCFENACSNAAGSYAIQLVYSGIDCNTNIACYDVQLRNTAGTNWGLAGQNYRLYYDASLAAFASGTSILGSDYQSFNLIQDIQDADASGTGNLAFESNFGFLNYSIDLLDPMTGGDSLVADGTWKTTSQLCFALEGDILTNPTSCLEAVWGRQDSTSSYGTSFVEVSEWVEANNTQMATGDAYNDLTSADGAGSCFENACSNAAGSYAIQLVYSGIDCNTNIACYDVQLRNTAGTNWGLAGQNYRLYYDASLAAFASGTSILGSDYQSFNLIQDIQDADASGTGNLAFESNFGFLNYSIDLLDPMTGGDSLVADGTWKTTSQLCFALEGDILTNPNSCLEAVWGRQDSTSSYGTSFVEVSEWVEANDTQMATGDAYNDLTSADGVGSCFENACSNAAGSYDIQLVYSGIDCNTNIACYDVQLRNTAGTNWGLAGQNYRLYYDASLAAFASGTSVLGSDYQNFNLIQDIQDTDASGTGNLAFESNFGFLNYSIDLLDPMTGGDSLVADGTWKTTSQLCFALEGDILTNPTSCLEAVWGRQDSTSSYGTSFVEVSEWVEANDTQMATGDAYNDLTSADGAGSCFENACSNAAGSYDIQLVYSGIDCNTNIACYDVQLRNTAGTNWGLAGQNYRLYYDASLAAFASGTSILGSDYQNFNLIQDIQDVDASGTGNLAFESNFGFLNYSIDLLDPMTGGDSLVADGTWKTTSQLCFVLEGDILTNPNSCLEAVWGRQDSTSSYGTSFVEVSEWVEANDTQMATGDAYNDLTSADGVGSCFENACSNAAGSYDIQLVYSGIDCNTNIACYDVQLRNTAGTNWGLAGQNYRLYYDASLAAFASGTSVLGNDYQSFNLVQDIQDVDASGTGNLAFESNFGFLNYSIDLLDPMTGGDSLVADGTWKTTSQLCFALEGDILTNPTSCLEAVWGRQDSTSSYGTSFVEVSEWVEANNTQMATGDAYNDLTSADGAGSCFENACSNAAGSYDIQLVYSGIDCNTNIACYDVQLRNTAGTNWGLAGQNYRLYYDASLAAFASGTSVLGSDYQSFNLVQDIQDVDASGTGNLAFESNFGFLNYSIDLLDPMTGGDSLLADGTWKTTSQLCFALEGDILTNPNSCLEAVWGRQDTTSSYGTSFVEVSEWVEANDTQMATGDAYNDLTSADGVGSCFEGLCLFDYGDLPDVSANTASNDYQTLSANNGPAHLIIPGLSLGQTVDAETEGQQSPDALGDSLDEDGFIILPSLDLSPNGTFKLPFSYRNETSDTAYIKAWIDWNGDGDFEDSDERIADWDDADGPFSDYLIINIPENAKIDAFLGFRIRISLTDNMTPYGRVNSGEVEDYLISIDCPQVTCLPATTTVIKKE